METIRPYSSFIDEFYSNEGKFNNFKDIKEKEIAFLKEQVVEIRDYLEKRCRVYARRYGFYIDAMKYLLELERQELINTDQRMILFILLMDPELEIYNVYMKNPRYNKKEIDEETDKTNQNYMYQNNYRSTRNIEYILKFYLGCVDERLIEYEIAYKNNVLCKGIINKDVHVDQTKKLLRMSDNIVSLEEIDNDRFLKLMMIANRLKEEIVPLSLTILSNAIINQRDILGINSELEQVILFLLVSDPDYHLIDIYEEESRYQNIERRAKNELGYYNKSLIKIEKMMLCSFHVTKKEANWMLLKSN